MAGDVNRRLNKTRVAANEAFLRTIHYNHLNKTNFYAIHYMTLISNILSKIDFRLTGNAFSRPSYQVDLLIKTLNIDNKRYLNVLDIGGGKNANYKAKLLQISEKYINLEINKGPHVDLVGSIYDLPISSSSIEVITLFMVLEHLSDPLSGLKECRRVMKRNGLIAITTVQYWHTHSHPNDYFRYTKEGLEHLCNKAGLKVVKIWSQGGPFLVIFHAIELNLSPLSRLIFSILFYKVADLLDWIFYKHSDSRENYDSLGWSLIAKKI